jgi:hypothetical protein
MADISDHLRYNFLSEPHIDEELRRLAGLPQQPTPQELNWKYDPSVHWDGWAVMSERQRERALAYYNEVKPAVDELRQHGIAEMKKLDLAAEEKTIEPMNSYSWEERVQATKKLHELNRVRGIPVFWNALDENQDF